MNIETPFRQIQFFMWDVPAAKDDYFKICDWLSSHNFLVKGNEGMITDYHTQDPAHDNEVNRKRVDVWHEFVHKHMFDNLEEFRKELGGEDIWLQNIWTQQTMNDQHHGIHNHGEWENGSNWSWVWYIDVDPRFHKPTCYYNLPNCEEEWHAPIKEGRFVMWPSHLLHMQPASNVAKKRCILSGNLHVIGLDE